MWTLWRLIEFVHDSGPPRPLVPLAAGRVRYRVVVATVAMAGITYLDRVCISILAPSIMRDLRLTQIEMGYAFSAFTLAYANADVCKVSSLPTHIWPEG